MLNLLHSDEAHLSDNKSSGGKATAIASYCLVDGLDAVDAVVMLQGRVRGLCQLND
jgi:coenzyme F420-reducing hydrogenase beta subunit